MIAFADWKHTLLSAAVGVMVGMLICAWRAHLDALRRKRIPKRWPLNSRVIVNTEECRVWGWLSGVFYDHHIMIKTPVTRFTLPRSRESGAHWYQLLSGVYCTFNVCAADGRVVGCVDVPRKNGLSRSNRQLKRTLLSQCGIAYCVVNSHSLPSMEEMRSEFLGEVPAAISDTRSELEPLVVAREKLQTAIEKRPQNRTDAQSAPTRHNPQQQHSDSESQLPESDFGAGTWQLNNSFVAPLDSRTGDLR